MKKFYSLLIVSLFAVQFAQTSAQETKVTIEDFITEHDGFEVNADGEIKPINNREINKKIRFFIEEKYLNVQFTRNIILKIQEWMQTRISKNSIRRYYEESNEILVPLQ